MATTMEADITKALQATLHARVGELLAEEIKKAKEHIERRIREEADKMALDILNFYSIERHQQNIVITVKKP